MTPDFEDEKYGIRLYRGNCIDIVPQLPAESIDAVITDPPYGTIRCSWDSVIPFDVMWDFIHHCSKPNSPTILTGSEPFSSALRMSNIKEYKYDWVWEKEQGSNFLSAKFVPLKNHEMISVFYSGSVLYNPQMEKGKPYITGSGGDKTEVYGNFERVRTKNPGTRYPKTVLKFKRDIEGYHSTQKPVALMEYLIRTYTNPGDTVLDFTMGSGTTGVAAVNTGRKFVGIEMDSEKYGDKYFRIATKRIKTAIQEAESDMFR